MAPRNGGHQCLDNNRDNKYYDCVMRSHKPSSPRSPRVQAQFEAYAAVLKAAEDLQRGFSEMLKSHDLSPSQYNVLRVLRGAGAAGLACGEVGDRLIRHDPDITRLLDRLEKRGLVQRVREKADRRVVRTSI